MKRNFQSIAVLGEDVRHWRRVEGLALVLRVHSLHAALPATHRTARLACAAGVLLVAL